MTKKIPILFLGILAAPLVLSEATNRIHFPQAGFSIAPLDSASTGKARQVVAMLLPTVDGFAGNVGVRIQPHSGTIDDYTSLSLEQFKEQKVTVIANTSLGQKIVTFECRGKVQGRLLHWYQRAELCNGQIYLATATSLESQWVQEASALKACIDSLRCDPDESPDGKAAKDH